MNNFRRNITLLTAFLICGPVPALPQQSGFGLEVPQSLESTGFLRFIVPRFSLKTGIKIEIQAADPEAVFSTESGTPIMEGLGQNYYLQVFRTESTRSKSAQRFADWLGSDVGGRTIEQFTIDGVSVFTAIDSGPEVETATVFTGDAVRGEAYSYTNCGRCHVIGEANRMKGIGSTPSFALLRALPDWEERFITFFVRIPHPAITQLEGVSEPFDPARPPTIAPLMLTVDDLDDILSFVSTVEPADLGAPLIVH